MIKSYVKKPISIEAEQFLPDKEPLPFSSKGSPCQFDGEKWFIETLEGNHLLTYGDYVIKGIRGEFYPCKEAIFLESYSELED